MCFKFHNLAIHFIKNICKTKSLQRSFAIDELSHYLFQLSSILTCSNDLYLYLTLFILGIKSSLNNFLEGQDQ